MLPTSFVITSLSRSVGVRRSRASCSSLAIASMLYCVGFSAARRGNGFSMSWLLADTSNFPRILTTSCYRVRPVRPLPFAVRHQQRTVANRDLALLKAGDHAGRKLATMQGSPDRQTRMAPGTRLAPGEAGHSSCETDLPGVIGPDFLEQLFRAGVRNLHFIQFVLN